MLSPEAARRIFGLKRGRRQDKCVASVRNSRSCVRLEVHPAAKMTAEQKGSLLWTSNQIPDASGQMSGLAKRIKQDAA
jgi:hypothetical protein